MLYSEHLWDKLDTVLAHWETEKEATTDIINVYLRIRKLSLAFAEGLEKQLTSLATANFDIETGSPLAVLRGYATAVILVQRGFAEGMLSDIAGPLQATLTLQAVTMREPIAKGKKYCKKLQEFRKKQEKAESRVTSVGEVERFFLKRRSLDRSAIERQKVYNLTVDSLNKFLEDNADDMKRITDILQKGETDRLEVVKKTLIDYAELTQRQGQDLIQTGKALQDVRAYLENDQL